MATKRWLAPWKDDLKRPVIYHLVGRVVDRQFVFGVEEREHFRSLMRLYERFSGCRVLSYVIMSNHYHLLLEVPPIPEGGLTPEDIFKRLGFLYSGAKVGEIRALWESLRASGDTQGAAEFLAKFTARMHDLSHFMRGLLQRFTRWFNRRHQRSGTLWEQRFKSVIVEDGVASRTMAAYIDLNPVRAGMVKDPADYRWSSYGEAVAGGKRARAGLVRALEAHLGKTGTAKAWSQRLAKEYRFILLEGAEEKVEGSGKLPARTVRKGMSAREAQREKIALEKRKRDLAIGHATQCRIRYLADGAVIGSKTFVDEVFTKCRDRFGKKRKTGARKPRGALGSLTGQIWTARDLKITP